MLGRNALKIIAILYCGLLLTCQSLGQEVKLFGGQIVLPPGTNYLFVGERHNVFQCNENNLRFIEEVIKTGKKCRIYLEMESAAVYKMNDYFESGDTLILLEIFKANHFYVGCHHQPYIDFYKKVRAKLIQSGNQNNVTFFGLDLVIKFRGSFNYLSQQLRMNKISDEATELSNYIDEAVKSKSYYNLDTLGLIVDKIDKVLKSSIFSDSLLKDKLFNTVKDLKGGYSCLNSGQAILWREDYIYDKVLNDIKENPNDLCLFIMGNDHISKEIPDDRPLFNPLARRLTQNPSNSNVTSVLFSCNKVLNERGENRTGRLINCTEQDSLVLLRQGKNCDNILKVNPAKKNCFEKYDYVITCSECISWAKEYNEMKCE